MGGCNATVDQFRASRSKKGNAQTGLGGDSGSHQVLVFCTTTDDGRRTTGHNIQNGDYGRSCSVVLKTGQVRLKASRGESVTAMQV